MDIKQLNERYPDGIPEALQSGIVKFTELSQKKGIKLVKLMGNFSIDLENTLAYGSDVYKGLIVQTSTNYKLEESDIIWFHPQLTKTRSMYDGEINKNDYKLPKFNSSIGVYSTYQVDELGAQKMEKFTIVDTPYSEIKTVVDHWLACRTDMRDVYNEFKNETIQEKTYEEHDSLCSGNLMSRHGYVSLYKGANIYHFYNHVLKSNGETLVLQSPLMGYSMVSIVGDIASDMCTDLLDVNQLTQGNRNRIFSDCTWDDDNIANTYVMRRGEIINGEAFRMVKCCISSNNIVDKLDATTILKLTPRSGNIPKSFDGNDYHMKDVLKFTATDELAMKLMKYNWRTMISSKYLKDGSLLVPRGMVEKYLI